MINSDRENRSDFEWQTEEDSAPIWGPVALRKPARRWFAPLALVVAALLVVGLVAFRHLERRVDEAAAVAREELLTTHRLLDRAATLQDSELVTTLLLNHAPAWVEIQQELLDAGLFFDRSGLRWTAAGQAPEVTAVHLSPDLQRAEVIFQQQYLVTAPNGQGETALFQHTAVYHHNGEQWLLAPHTNDFWGRWRGSRRQRLNLLFPERDGAVSDRLAGDLDLLIDKMCRTVDDLNCPVDLHVQVRLERQPAHLQRLLKSEATLSSGQSIELPAPSLIGLPLNEAAYQALYQEYAVRVVAAIIGHLVEWSCCERLPFYQVLLDKQLRQLGLRPWPVTDDHHRYLIHSPPRLLQLGRYWHRSLPVAANLEDGWLLYAFADFAQHATPEFSIAGRQRLLSQAEDYMQWVRQSLNSPDDTADVWELVAQWERSWLLFAHSQLEQPAGSAWSEQEITLACLPAPVEAMNDGSPPVRRRLEVGSANWLPGPEPALELLGRPSPQMGLPGPGFTALPLPGYQGTVLQVEATTEAGGQRLQLFGWRGQSEEPLFDSALTWPGHERPLFEFTAITDPSGELLLFRDSASSTVAAIFWLLDTAACRQGACDFQRLHGRPVWSPDGTRTVPVSDVTGAAAGQPVTLLLADRWGANAVPLAEGYAPFWLDTERVGYFQRRPLAALFTVNVAALETGQSLPFADQQPISPGLVRQVTVHPSHPEWLFLLLEARQRFAVSLHSGTGERVVYQPADAVDQIDLLPLPLGGLHADATGCPDQNCWRTESFSLSPDGRWLATLNHVFQDILDSSWFVFHDLHRELPPRIVAATVTVAAVATGHYSWSADGHWFLLPDPQLLRLYSPTADTFHYRLLEQHCFFAGWVGGEAVERGSSTLRPIR